MNNIIFTQEYNNLYTQFMALSLDIKFLFIGEAIAMADNANNAEMVKIIFDLFRYLPVSVNSSYDRIARQYGESLHNLMVRMNI